jgi:hypothetical protein
LVEAPRNIGLGDGFLREATLPNSFKLINDNRLCDGLVVVAISGNHPDGLQAEVSWPELPGMPAGVEPQASVEYALLKADIITRHHGLPDAVVKMDDPTLWRATWGRTGSDPIEQA